MFFCNVVQAKMPRPFSLIQADKPETERGEEGQPHQSLVRATFSSISRPSPQQEKIQRTGEKRCTVNHVAEFENGTPILKERRFGGIL